MQTLQSIQGELKFRAGTAYALGGLANTCLDLMLALFNTH